MKKKPQTDKPQYTLIPNPAIEDMIERGLGRPEILAYIAICKHYNPETKNCWPSLMTIGKYSCLARKNVGRALLRLCETGMVLIQKTKNANSLYENNTYYLPHMIDFQIKSLSADDPKKNRKQIAELSKFKLYLLEQIEKQRGALNMRAPALNMRAHALKKKTGGLKSDDGVASTSPTNITIINSTNNNTINVDKNDENLTSESIKPKKHITRVSLSTPQAIGGISTLVNLKNEGLAQEIAGVLNDYKSLPFFRSVVSKLINHEEIIHKCLSLTRETEEITGIKKSKGAVFTDHLKREALQLGIDL